MEKKPKYILLTLVLSAVLQAGIGYAADGGYIPEFLDYSHLWNKPYKIEDPSGLKTEQTVKPNEEPEAELPEYYSIRDMLITPSNQREFGSCWTFAAVGAVESALAFKGDPVDLSEWHQLYWSFNDHSEELYGYNHAGAQYYMSGGNLNMANAILTRGTGAVRNEQAPFPGELSGVNPASTQVYPAEYLPRAYVVRGAYAVKDAGGRGDSGVSQEHIDNAKRAIMKYGGLAMSIYQDDSYIAPSTYGFYTDKLKGTANHVVVIVGWDDNFPAEKFLESHRPPVNGAWICRNSYGPNWCDGGYYYVSYAEKTLDGGYVYSVEKEDPSLEILAYDALGPSSFTGSFNGKPQGYGNIFTAESDIELEKIAFYTNEPDLKCSISVYKDCQGTPSSGTLISTFEQIVPTPGYNTIDLPDSIPFTAGETFSVVVRIPEADYFAQIPIMGVNANYYYSGKAKAVPGHCFYMSTNDDGEEVWEDAAEWNEMQGANQCAVSLRAIVRHETPLSTKTGPYSVKLKPGESTVLAYNAGVEWSSNDPDIASVAADGTVTAKKNGKTYVKAVCDGIPSYTFVLVTDGSESSWDYSGGGSSGGCNTGLGVLALITAVPLLVLRKSRRTGE